LAETTTATLVALEAGRDVIEFNASDVRSKKAMHEQMGDITGSQTIQFQSSSSAAGGRTNKKSTPKKLRCIVMDEVDGMGAGDRSGVAELIQMIKKTKVPIIAICNDRQNQKLKSLIPHCMDLRYKRPMKTQIATRAMQVAAQEGWNIEKNAAEAIAESCGNDVRQVLNCLQMWASDDSKDDRRMTYKGLKDREKSINKDEVLRISLFDAARILLEGRRGLASCAADPATERDHFMRRNDAFFVDYNFTGLLVQQNYLKVVQGAFNDAKRANNDKTVEVLERMADAAGSMSDFALAEQTLRVDQNWAVLPFVGALVVKTGYHAGGESGGFVPGFPEFTTWLGRNSTKGKKIRLLHELRHHMNYHISCGTDEMRMSYVPVLRNRFLSLVVSNNNNNDQQDNMSQAIRLMDDYGLDRDDIFEKLDEFNMNPRDKGFSQIDSKKKAAFTRTYNAGSHTSQVLVAEQGGGAKKMKRKASSSLDEETIDPDAINDDKQEEPEDEEDDESDGEKLAAAFLKKGKKKNAPAAVKKAAATKTTKAKPKPRGKKK
jgi:replication factor C subunit 1